MIYASMMFACLVCNTIEKSAGLCDNGLSEVLEELSLMCNQFS